MRIHAWVVAASFVVAISGSSAVVGDAGAISEIVVFGSSTSDQGNALLLVGAGSPPYFEGRFTNGPNWIDILADELGLPRPAPSEAGGTNYAVAGAETGAGFGTLAPFAPNLGQQVIAFGLDGHVLDGDELIVVRGGANDALAQALLEPPDETFWTPGRAVANIGDHVRALASAGGTRFLVANLGGFADSPFFRPLGLTEDVTLWQEEFSEGLKSAMEALRGSLGVSISVFDADKVALKLLQQPARLGLVNLLDPACPGCGFGRPEPGAGDTVVPNPDQYFYWDLVHTTGGVHAYTGRRAAEQVQEEIP
jgi:phospholipase/lecithinase/hemolysin